MIDTAPQSEPNKRDYPDLISYIKAKARWNIASNYATIKHLESTHPDTKSSSHNQLDTSNDDNLII